MPNKDAKFVNCSEEHELNQVCGKYEDREKVRDFIKEKCKDKTIHYWTHEKLAAFLAENGFKLKQSIGQTEFINRLAGKFESKAQAQAAFNAVISTLAEVLQAGDSISIKGFGSFKIMERAARNGRHPISGEPIAIAASKTIKFTPAAALKDGLK